jgi:hypothetical protein
MKASTTTSTETYPLWGWAFRLLSVPIRGDPWFNSPLRLKIPSDISYPGAFGGFHHLVKPLIRVKSEYFHEISRFHESVKTIFS